MTDHSERDEAAEAYLNKQYGSTNRPINKSGAGFIDFIAGADWAVKNDPRVLKLVEAVRAAHSIITLTHPDLSKVEMSDLTTLQYMVWTRNGYDDAITEWSKP